MGIESREHIEQRLSLAHDLNCKAKILGAEINPIFLANCALKTFGKLERNHVLAQRLLLEQHRGNGQTAVDISMAEALKNCGISSFGDLTLVPEKTGLVVFNAEGVRQFDEEEGLFKPIALHLIRITGVDPAGVEFLSVPVTSYGYGTSRRIIDPESRFFVRTNPLIHDDRDLNQNICIASSFAV